MFPNVLPCLTLCFLSILKKKSVCHSSGWLCIQTGGVVRPVRRGALESGGCVRGNCSRCGQGYRDLQQGNLCLCGCFMFIQHANDDRFKLPYMYTRKVTVPVSHHTFMQSQLTHIFNISLYNFKLKYFTFLWWW